MRRAHTPFPTIYFSQRILRPPNARSFDPPVPRQFSHKPRLFLVTRISPLARPQLPFLHPSSQYLSNGRLARLFTISANNKKFLKETARLSVKYSIIIWLLTTCTTIAGIGFLSERQEREFPSPHEWSLWTRLKFRQARWYELPENNDESGVPNWPVVWDEFNTALKRLEDPHKDGAGLVEQEDGQLVVPGVGKAGFDVTAKSEEWRQGYFEVLYGMGQAAERLEGWMTNKRRNEVWHPMYIASATNPRPKTPAPGNNLPPPEGQIFPWIDNPPETYYMKILTTQGFTTNQRLQAAIAYADYLVFKNLPDSAEETYRWALDIAISGLPTLAPEAVIDRQTAVFSSTAPSDLVTPNLILAATNLATFHASRGNIASALPIYLSVLRARLTAPTATEPLPRLLRDSSVMGTLAGIFSLQGELEYPALPPTGDEPLLRREEDRCEEAALKNYIGEILFATAGSSTSLQRQGLYWVRDAVSTAKLAQSLDVITADDERRKKCEKCEEVGLESWGKIMTFLSAQARENVERSKEGLGGLVTRIWTGTEALVKEAEELEDEEEGVVMRLNKLRGKMMREEWEELDRKYARTFVI